MVYPLASMTIIPFLIIFMAIVQKNQGHIFHGIVHQTQKNSCDHIKEKWACIKDMVNSLTDETATKVTVSFLHFEKVEIMTKRGVSKKLKPVKSDATIFYIINFIENFLIKFVYHRNKLKHFRSSVNDFYNFFDSVNIDMDFSVNLTLLVKKQPQSLHWSNS